MRFFHLADLHIGKWVDGVSMLEEAQYALNQVLDYIDTYQPDGILLSGDIYDRRNPAADAVECFDEFLSRVILEKKVPVYAIGGNHDSGERLSFANHLLEKTGLYLAGSFDWPVRQARWQKNGEKVDFHLLPYADLANLQHAYPKLKGMKYPEAIQQILADMELADDARHVLLAHGVVLGGEEPIYTDSERDISIGGAESWSSEHLNKFDYVALGHLHRAQKAGSDHIRYAGSLCKYSFSEENHEKVVLMVDLDQNGEIVVENLPLTPLHDMKTITGSLDELLENGIDASYREDYLRVQLTDKGELPSPMARLKKVYPRALVLERLAPVQTYSEEDRFFSNLKIDSPKDLLLTFMEKVKGMDLEKTEEIFLTSWLQEAEEEQKRCDR